MKILVSGGCGYIGSHTVVDLLKENYEVVIVDNLINSKREVLDNIKKITNKEVTFYKVDLCDKEKLKEVFEKESIDAVIHFAGLKAVGESVEKPLMYYENNLISTINLLDLMREFNVKKIVFSSSATVYGNPDSLPIYEDFPLSTTNPYGTTKLMIENILKDLYKSDNSFDITILRYFNPIGAHKSGLLGEDPNGIPNNLMPYIVRVATGKFPILNIFGDDYKTVDGTGVRDYIHVCDLSYGHVLALKNKKTGLKIYNLGTGKGTSVLELVKKFESVNGVKVNYQIAPRRDGDIDACYASNEKAVKELGFKPKYTIEDMCRDSYNFVKMNTN
ncbi:MAG: UDP-glucose 4-epimerase GalE [Bacilli bacterium]|nr:UDP-glucose 4-epimerase GalE [Bacilli bacterium]